jgi:hypothetical protein
MACCGPAYQHRKLARLVRRCVLVIPTTTAGVSPPVTEGNLNFHVVVDFTNQSFSMDGPKMNGGAPPPAQKRKVQNGGTKDSCRFLLALWNYAHGRQSARDRAEMRCRGNRRDQKPSGFSKSDRHLWH